MQDNVKGAELLATLEKIKGGEFYDIFNLLPDSAGGAEWIKEIKYTAQRVAEYIHALDDYSLEDLRDYGNQYANGECETYYFNINAEVQALSLWGLEEVSDYVAELNEGRPYPSFTDLNSQYLYAGKQITWDAVVDQAFQNTNQEELVEA